MEREIYVKGGGIYNLINIAHYQIDLPGNQILD